MAIAFNELSVAVTDSGNGTFGVEKEVYIGLGDEQLPVAETLRQLLDDDTPLITAAIKKHDDDPGSHAIIQQRLDARIDGIQLGSREPEAFLFATQLLGLSTTPPAGITITRCCSLAQPAEFGFTAALTPAGMVYPGTEYLVVIYVEGLQGGRGYHVEGTLAFGETVVAEFSRDFSPTGDRDGEGLDLREKLEFRVASILDDGAEYRNGDLMALDFVITPVSGVQTDHDISVTSMGSAGRFTGFAINSTRIPSHEVYHDDGEQVRTLEAILNEANEALAVNATENLFATYPNATLPTGTLTLTRPTTSMSMTRCCSIADPAEFIFDQTLPVGVRVNANTRFDLAIYLADLELRGYTLSGSVLINNVPVCTFLRTWTATSTELEQLWFELPSMITTAMQFSAGRVRRLRFTLRPTGGNTIDHDVRCVSIASRNVFTGFAVNSDRTNSERVWDFDGYDVQTVRTRLENGTGGAGGGGGSVLASAVEFTLLANGWTGTSQTVAIAGITADTGFDFNIQGLLPDATNNAATAATLRVTAKGAGSITVTATSGTVPTMNVPCFLRVFLPAGATPPPGGYVSLMQYYLGLYSLPPVYWFVHEDGFLYNGVRPTHPVIDIAPATPLIQGVEVLTHEFYLPVPQDADIAIYNTQGAHMHFSACNPNWTYRARFEIWAFERDGTTPCKIYDFTYASEFRAVYGEYIAECIMDGMLHTTEPKFAAQGQVVTYKVFVTAVTPIGATPGVPTVSVQCGEGVDTRFTRNVTGVTSANSIHAINHFGEVVTQGKINYDVQNQLNGLSTKTAATLAAYNADPDRLNVWLYLVTGN